MVNHFFSPARAGRLTAIAVAITIAAVPAIAQPEPVDPPQPNYELRLGGAEPAAGQACFFERYGYSGNEFCAVAGEVAMYLPGDWAREISSFQLGPGTIVEVCTDWALVNCTSFSSSETELSEEIDDNIRSLRVSWAPDYTPPM
ncbi:MAG: hypothetical protein KIT43_11270 [Bauldia sp.]|nr:hypothetical protein [Bauldia sp.]MCW5716433.1 hypothetical protein [Bauldia sp.]